MDWKQYYQEHTMSPEDAVSLMKSGDLLLLGHAVGEALLFQRTMAAMKDQFKDVTVEHMVYLGTGDYLQPEMQGHFRHNALFVGGPARKAVAENRADVTPIHFHEFPIAMREGYLVPDVFAFTCTPPDDKGYVSLGTSVDYGVQAIKSAKTVVAEVNPTMPRTFGESFVHVSEIDAFIKNDVDHVPEIQPPTITEKDEAIGKYIADLVEDGSCLQLGIGAVPDAVLHFLTDKKDLGIHSEMISDGTIELFEKGVINGKAKNIDNGKAVVTFLMGTKKLYEFADNNPMIKMMPVDYTNDPYVVAQLDNVVAINSCVAVDFTGQVCAEAIGTRQISGIGGQGDFVRGTNMSKGGKSIIAMHSTTKGDSASKIVNMLDLGSPVTTPRTDVDYVVTEYGVAKLRWVPIRERARRLIAIAHPKFRDELAKEYEERFGEPYKA